MTRVRTAIVAAVAIGAVMAIRAQPVPSLPMTSCDAKPKPAFCTAVRGDRAEGWPAQTRSEVMARRGMVVTSQPLA
ncbi:MAG TPA: hypothetical protein VFP91_08475, partial [Vicinamibacterales bacterium]|nr:hypothetical protein [Vicinamibacterales bacterium]